MKTPHSRTLFELLCEEAECGPACAAVICGERIATYRDLADGAGRIGGALKGHGIGRGDRVGILFDNRLEWLEACFGASALGACAVPFSTWSKPGELSYLLADSEVDALIAVNACGGQDFAAALKARGIGRGDRVGILIGNRIEWLEACFGATALGAVAVPFSTWSKPAELAYLLADSEVAALIAVDRFGGQNFAAALSALTPQAPQLRLIVMLGGDLRPGWIAYEEFRAAAPLGAPAGADPADDAMILYTSGSSARPKAVRLQHFAIIENGFAIGERMALSPDDRVLLAPPLFWAYGACNALPATLTHGAALVLQGSFEPGEWLGLVERHRVTAISPMPPPISAPGCGRAASAAATGSASWSTTASNGSRHASARARPARSRCRSAPGRSRRNWRFYSPTPKSPR